MGFHGMNWFPQMVRLQRSVVKTAIQRTISEPVQSCAPVIPDCSAPSKPQSSPMVDFAVHKPGQTPSGLGESIAEPQLTAPRNQCRKTLAQGGRSRAANAVNPGDGAAVSGAAEDAREDVTTSVAIGSVVPSAGVEERIRRLPSISSRGSSPAGVRAA